jgi:ketosteroid isomerase-like protein
MSNNISIVQASYDAFHRRDISGVLAALAPNVQWTHPDGMSAYGLGGTKNGHDEVIAFIKRVPSYIAEIILNPQEFIESGDRIVVFGTRRVTTTSGRSGTFRFVHSWRFADGKAITFEDYFDTAELISLIGDQHQNS